MTMPHEILPKAELVSLREEFHRELLKLNFEDREMSSRDYEAFVRATADHDKFIEPGEIYSFSKEYVDLVATYISLGDDFDFDKINLLFLGSTYDPSTEKKLFRFLYLDFMCEFEVYSLPWFVKMS